MIYSYFIYCQKNGKIIITKHQNCIFVNTKMKVLLTISFFEIPNYLITSLALNHNTHNYTIIMYLCHNTVVRKNWVIGAG